MSKQSFVAIVTFSTLYTAPGKSRIEIQRVNEEGVTVTVKCYTPSDKNAQNLRVALSGKNHAIYLYTEGVIIDWFIRKHYLFSLPGI